MNNLNFQSIELTDITDKESASISGGLLPVAIGILLTGDYIAANFYLRAVKVLNVLRRLNQQILDEEKPPKPYVSGSAPGEDISSNRRLSGSGRYL